MNGCIRKIIYSFVLAVVTAVLPTALHAANSIKKDFKPTCDSLAVLLRERTGVECKLEVSKILKRRNVLDFYFTVSLGDMPLRPGDTGWFKKKLKSLMPKAYSGYEIGEIYSRREKMAELEIRPIGNSGQDGRSRFRVKEPDGAAFVENVSKRKFDKGLSGRNIAIWQSHGRYYEQSLQRWEWQRPCLFGTCEDMMSASFVLQYLVPMVENAGGYVMLPRERDTSTEEYIIDNDNSDLKPTSRTAGTFTVEGEWKTQSQGFADTTEFLLEGHKPFTSGTSLISNCTDSRKNKGCAIWRLKVDKSGKYAVYVTYSSSAKSSPSATYIIDHAGGRDTVLVNQKMGGGTWVYIGSFPMDTEKEVRVTLENLTPRGRRFNPANIVCADGIRIGGGMGNAARKDESDSLAFYETSGLPRYAEGARYWLQWAGADSTIYSQNSGVNDYKDDFMSRGDWVNWLCSGSAFSPKAKGKGIPVDMAFAFHSDAGVTPNDSTIGTLAIYTHYSENRKTYPDGEKRLAGREYADAVQSQVVNDLRETFDNQWTRRWIWDRSYRESRTPPVPTILLETFSHQNFADMKLALDPYFRFTVARAIYKGMLKFISGRYSKEYKVQPLPVNSFSAALDGNTVTLEWKETPDRLEPTAAPEGYMVYIRKGNGVFDKGQFVRSNRLHIKIESGEILSFKVTAINEGGESFPSEILSVGRSIHDTDGYKDSDRAIAPVLVVNNFTRVSGPVWFDTPQYAGFDWNTDGGVPYMSDISFVGPMYQFRRELPWTDDDDPGFGASWQDYAGKAVAGNTFDYTYTHGRALMNAGYSFCSCSVKAFEENTALGENVSAIDLICGKQVRIPRKDGSHSFAIFSDALCAKIERLTLSGKSILVSGAYIGTDIWDRLYPEYQTDTTHSNLIESKERRLTDSTETAIRKAFAEKVLGYRWRTCHGGRSGIVVPAPWTRRHVSGPLREFRFHTETNSEKYCVEAPDGIVPASSKSKTILRYKDTSISAGICYDAGCYRTVCLGFPVESLCSEESIDEIIESIFKYLIP